MEKEPWVETLKENPSLQTKTNFIRKECKSILRNCMFKESFAGFIIVFPSKRTRSVAQFVKDNKTKIFYAKTCKMLFVTTSFDLWMSKGTHHIFALAINFEGRSTTKAYHNRFI